MKRLEARKLFELDAITNKINEILNKDSIISEQLIEANMRLVKIRNKFEYRKNNPLTMRQGMIIVLEEVIQNSRKLKRANYEFEVVYFESTNRFELIARHKKRFNNDLDYIHPENLRMKFMQISINKKESKRESFNSLLTEYKKSLEELLVAHSWYIDEPKVTNSLKKILNKEIFK